jgi:glucose/arabinose dehydrogenase
VAAQNSNFHGAPAAAAQLKNPQAGQSGAASSGSALYLSHCSTCHGENGKGTGNVPPLASGDTQAATDGELFWYISKGDVSNGMPSWTSLPASERWQLVSFIRSLPRAPAMPPPQASAGDTSEDRTAPAPSGPFTDFRYETPGRVQKITVADLPEPYATKSAQQGPKIVARPAGAWPKAVSGFEVQQYASGLDGPRLLRTAPNGDFFVAESEAGNIKILRGISSKGQAEQTQVFASGLNRPYGIAFFPPGPDPRWVYIGDTDAVLRFPYHNGDLKAGGAAEIIAKLPHGGGHWTRDVQFSLDGNRMWVGVGSASNIDDPDTTPGEKDRADILEFNPDGSGRRVYAYGIRNAGGGLSVNPKTGQLWCSVNERDGLGDNLVPDYITHVEPGGFYGWPWWYMGGHQDPRHSGKHPELKDKVITPDVVLPPHTASLEMTFYEGKQFPSDYQGDIFASEHGSWNRSQRVGYEVIRVPLHQSSHASGEYEEFLTGFVVDNRSVWGRPVGVTVAPDGSLLVSDDGSNTIWRVSYVGK